MNNWKTVKFGDVVRQVKDKVDPKKSGLKRYIAGGHMDTDDLHLQRWGDINNDYLGPAFHMRFKPGQVLYGSRRTYLRKVAIADFEGICANTTYVLESKDPKALLPELLPFIMSTEKFHEHSIRQSKGSVNPYINYSDIAWYEFPLPPLEEQRRIAKLLQAKEDLARAVKNAISKLRIVLSSHIDKEYSTENQGWNSKELIEFCLEKPAYGINASAKKHALTLPRFVRITDIDDYGQLGNDVVGVDAGNETEKYALTDGDFLFARTGATVGKTYLYSSDDGFCVFAGYLIRFKLDPTLLLPKFLYYFTKSSAYQRWILGTVRVGAQPNINASEYSAMKVPTPSIKEQIELVSNLEAITRRIMFLKNHERNILKMKKEFLDRYL